METKQSARGGLGKNCLARGIQRCLLAFLRHTLVPFLSRRGVVELTGAYPREGAEGGLGKVGKIVRCCYLRRPPQRRPGDGNRNLRAHACTGRHVTVVPTTTRSATASASTTTSTASTTTAPHG